MSKQSLPPLPPSWNIPIQRFGMPFQPLHGEDCGTCGIGVILASEDFLNVGEATIPHIKCLSMIQPGRTRQEVIILKSPIWLKLGRKIECHQHIHVLKHQVKIFHFTRDMGKTGKMAILAQIYAY